MVSKTCFILFFLIWQCEISQVVFCFNIKTFKHYDKVKCSSSMFLVLKCKCIYLTHVWCLTHTQWWKGLLTVVTWPTTWGVNHQRNTPKHTGLFVFQSHFQCLRIYFYVSIGFSIRKSRGGCGKGWNPSSLKSSVWFPHSHSYGFFECHVICSSLPTI